MVAKLNPRELEILRPTSLSEHASQFDQSFHTLMSWVRHGAIKPDVKLPGKSKRLLSLREKFLTLTTRNILNARLRFRSASCFNDFLRPFLQILAIDRVPPEGDYRKWLEGAFSQIANNIFLVAEPNDSTREIALKNGWIDAPLEPFVIALHIVGLEWFHKHIRDISSLGWTFTVVNTGTLVEEFFDRLHCYATSVEYKPTQPSRTEIIKAFTAIREEGLAPIKEK